MTGSYTESMFSTIKNTIVILLGLTLIFSKAYSKNKSKSRLEELIFAVDSNCAVLLAETLDEATDKFLENKKSPSRKVNELDNRGSHFYLTTYWAQALAAQNKDLELKEQFSKIAEALEANEALIINELNSSQGSKGLIGGYYHFDDELTKKVMRPSATFNTIIESISKKALA